VTLQEQKWVVGNMVGIWNKVAWLQDAPQTTPNTHAYPSIVIGAEYSWNFWPDLFNPGVPLGDDFFRSRPQAQARMALDPVAGAKMPRPIPLAGAAAMDGLPVGALQFGALSFQTDGRALAPQPGQSATVAIDRPVAALYFLHAAEVEDADAMREALKAAAAWEGIHIGSYGIQYASGQTASVPIRCPMELRDPLTGSGPTSLAYRALGVYPIAREAESRCVYAVQWVNPRPDDRVERVTLKAIEAPARPVLAGLAVQEP
jgi:hypothetical protein